MSSWQNRERKKKSWWNQHKPDRGHAHGGTVNVGKTTRSNVNRTLEKESRIGYIKTG